MTDSRSLTVLKAALLAGAVVVYLWPLATVPGLVLAALGTVVGVYSASRLQGVKIRVLNWVVLAGAVAGGGAVLAALFVGFGSWLPSWFTLMLADGLVLGFSAFALFLALHLLSSRVQAFSMLEVAVVVWSVAHFFADHRNMRIHQPRFLSDWAWSHGFEPEPVLSFLGVAVMGLSALLLLRTSRARRLLAMVVLLLGGFLMLLLVEPPRLDVPKVDELGLRGGGENGQGSSSSSNSNQKPPEPIAVVVLHDDLPEANALYFRQAVRSQLVGTRLVEDSSGLFDTDVPNRVAARAAVEVKTPQVPAFHRALETSVFLLADHAQWFGVGFPERLTAVVNPNPRRFVAAYDVQSQFLIRPVTRMLGRNTLPDEWPESRKQHYLAVPPDPRYLELSDRIVRDIDPRFFGDSVMKALALKEYLEKEGFYSLKEKTLDGDDPVATFLFGSLRGYCVHFAHAAVFLLRSQGIPSRVAIGYGVQTEKRGAGSAVLIFANEAHAWPEMFVEGVGWVTFDINPRQSDEPPGTHVDQDLEAALGELTRKDLPGTLESTTPLVIPWARFGWALVTLLSVALAIAMAIKVWRRFDRTSPRAVYRSVLDALSEVGVPRRVGESRERHAARVSTRAPSFVKLTALHLRLALGGDDAATQTELLKLAAVTRAELNRNVTWWMRVAAALNPIGWLFTR